LWQRDGLCPPEDVRLATQDYRNEQDTLGAWVAECCVTKAGAKTPTRDLYACYVQWADGLGERPVSVRTFGQELTTRGFPSEKGSKGVSVRLGVGLVIQPTRATPEEF
jgi:putative DNA primase/helicase